MDAGMYRLQQEQWIGRPIHEVFAFFCDAHNLEVMTPPWLNFKILSMSAPAIGKGTQIRYQLRLHGFPVRWLTEIQAWEPPRQFVDEQLTGPYTVWHHTHTFEEHGDRTMMKDDVRYKLPFGPLGRLVHALKVRRDVEQIFAYRRRCIDEHFSAPSHPKSAGPA